MKIPYPLRKPVEVRQVFFFVINHPQNQFVIGALPQRARLVVSVRTHSVCPRNVP